MTIFAPTNKRVIRPCDKPSFEHTQRYGLIRGHWANTNRVGLWLFNEGSGNKVFDLSGNNLIGTNAVPWTSGKFGSALDHSLSEHEVVISNNPILTQPNGFSIVVWMYWPSGSEKGRLVDKYTVNNREFEFGYYGTRVYAWAYDESASARVGRYTATAPTNSWNQITFTYDGGTTNSSVKIYINTVQKDITDFGSGTFVGIENLAADLKFGGSGEGTGGPLVGKIDHVLMFNYVLSVSERALLYREPFLGIQREPRITYFFVPTGGIIYQELNLTVTADASAAETDTHQMVETGKAISADASSSEVDTQQMIDTGKEVSADASILVADTQQMVETNKAVEAAASVSCTDLKVVFELNLEVIASGGVAVTDAHTMIEAGKVVTAIASPAVIDTQTMVETELGVSAEGSVSCIDTMGLLAHIAAFMILRQCTT